MSDVVGVAIGAFVMLGVIVVAFLLAFVERERERSAFVQKLIDSTSSKRSVPVELSLIERLGEMGSAAQDKLLAFSEDGRTYSRQVKELAALELELADARKGQVVPPSRPRGADVRPPDSPRPEQLNGVHRLDLGASPD